MRVFALPCGLWTVRAPPTADVPQNMFYRNNSTIPIFSKSNIMTYLSLFKNTFLLILYPDMRQLKDNKLLGKIALVLKDLRDENNVTQEDVYNETNN